MFVLFSFENLLLNIAVCLEVNFKFLRASHTISIIDYILLGCL